MAIGRFQGGGRQLGWGRLVIAAAVLVVAGAAAAAAVATGGHATRSSSHKLAVRLRSTAVGTIVVDSSGRTLYMFAGDRHGRSACSGKCAHFWPPVAAKKRQKALALGGARRSLIGWTRRKDGRFQLTYAKHPLYRFKLDAHPGQLKGQGLLEFGARWYVLSGSGHVVKKAVGAPPPPPTTTTTNSGGGGGWG